jgi:hypothetical protein
VKPFDSEGILSKLMAKTTSLVTNLPKILLLWIYPTSTQKNLPRDNKYFIWSKTSGFRRKY